MAVLEAVRGWEELAGLPHINDIKKGGDAELEGGEVVTGEGEKAGEPEDDGLWTKDELDGELEDILGTDYTQLLLDHEEHINAPTGDSLRKLKSPQPVSPMVNLHSQCSRLLHTSLTLFCRRTKHGKTTSSNGSSDSASSPKRRLARPVSLSSSFICSSLLPSFKHELTLSHWTSRTAESSRAQQNLATATSELNRIKGEKSEAESTIVKIFHPEHFGIEGEWKKLDDECLEYDYAE